MPRERRKSSDAHAEVGTKPQKRNGNGANLGFEAQLFLAADKLRKNLEPSDYKHVALGLIFLKYISNASRPSGRRCWRTTPPLPKTRTSISA